MVAEMSKTGMPSGWRQALVLTLGTLCALGPSFGYHS